MVLTKARLSRQNKLLAQITLLLILGSSYVSFANNYEAEFQTNDSTLTVSDTWTSSGTVNYNDFVAKVQTGEYVTIGTLLGAMMESYAEAQGNLESAQESFPVGASSIIVSKETGDVLVQVMFKNQDNSLDGRNSIPEGMEEQGFQVTHCVHNVCEGYVSLTNLMGISSLPEVLSILPVYKPLTNVGKVTSEGDPAMNTDIARSTYKIAGSGKSVGVLSDSFNCNKTVATNYFDDIASGDLPTGVTLLSEYLGSNCIDEGRAMMQLIYDVAPDTHLAFHTAFNGVLDFAQGIKDLANTGCDIIVDDSELELYLFCLKQWQQTITSNWTVQLYTLGNLSFKIMQLLMPWTQSSAWEFPTFQPLPTMRAIHGILTRDLSIQHSFYLVLQCMILILPQRRLIQFRTSF